MILTCDVGNTNIKTAVFVEDRISELNSFNDINIFFSYLKKIHPEDFAISSVVPSTTKIINDFIQSNFGAAPLIVNHNLKFNLKIDYDSIETLGIDRICSAEGAFKIFKVSKEFENYSEKIFIITIDFGTATTINIIRYPGIFAGGLIAPGIKMMFNSLTKNTAQLPSVDEHDYRQLIAKDTKSSIASGIINSILGMVEKTLEHLKENHGADDIKIFITGGNAEQILPYIDFKFDYQKALVLLGIKAIFEINK
ncbi:MAG: type III pantothenate kinase [Ignavibacteriaceae bacterium]